ncbi:uncharacterized protein LOC116339177 [Contarinia nasturtii]|uniref:uncharacterized protein LOC116339177 n=1 Tax=Contarinia nasturtii TaxID=265458 RepID=UPI0012D3B813|nr:uncharacterized protein LOC116339177 [Contarinia nasturtii]
MYIRKNRASIVFCHCVEPCNFADYEKKITFDFSPGHREIILNFPKIIEDMQSSKMFRNLSLEGTKAKNSSQLCAEYSIILNELLNVANKNKDRSKNAREYTDTLKYFATYIFTLCGRTCYETLHQNLPIPSTKTILRCINEYKTRIVEGDLRCKELLQYLTERNAGTDILLSEDASGIVSKIQYDSVSNHLIGIVLPFDEVNGCPKQYVSTAENLEEIKQFMQHNKSTLVYIVLAVPMKEGIPPFLLQMFGTNNKFNTEHVIRRWNFIINELKKYGIRVRGFSSDGDERLLAAMRHQMNQDHIPQIFVQDSIHCGTKMRNRLLRPQGLLPMGNKQVAVAHLKILIKDVAKEIHGLTYFTVCPNDRQNFKSLEKCMNIRTRNALLKYVPDSDATAFYLQICHQITSSFMDYNLMPLQRVELIFHSVFFLRAWRQWISSSEYSLEHNFITRNAYLCTEINAENLLRMIRQCRDEGKPELFLTTLCNSQACEQAFRQFRSMGTANWTKVNFSLLELLNMIGRLEVQNDLLYTKLSALNIPLPKLESKATMAKTKIYDLPSDSDIERSLERAKRSAIDDASKFGIIIDPVKIKVPGVRISRNFHDVELNDYGSDDEDEEVEYEVEVNENVNDNGQHNRLDDDEEEEQQQEEQIVQDDDNQRAYVAIIDNSGQKKHIRKSTIVWSLSDGAKKISSDRLVRVQQATNAIQFYQNRNLENSLNSNDKICVSQYITIGDWCFFKYKGTSDENELICIGSILGFRLANGNSEKEKIYKGDLVDLAKTPSLKNNLQLLSSWYFVNDNARLVPVKSENHSFLHMENYIASLLIKPILDADTHTLYFHQNDFKEVEDAILKLI